LRAAGEPLAPKEVVAAGQEEGYSRALIYRAREALDAQIRNTAGRRDPHNLWAWQAEDEGVTASPARQRVGDFSAERWQGQLPHCCRGSLYQHTPQV